MANWTDGQTALNAANLNRLPMTFGERKNVRVASIKVVPGATPTLTDAGFGGFSLTSYTRNAPGDYTLNFDGGFTETPIPVGIQMLATGGGNWTANISLLSTTSIRVRIFLAGVLSETGLDAFFVTVAGQM